MSKRASLLEGPESFSSDAAELVLVPPAFVQRHLACKLKSSYAGHEKILVLELFICRGGVELVFMKAITVAKSF